MHNMHLKGASDTQQFKSLSKMWIDVAHLGNKIPSVRGMLIFVVHTLKYLHFSSWWTIAIASSAI